MSTAPETVVRRFLQALAQRDATGAAAQLAAGAVLVGPGGTAHGSLEALFASSRLRYQFVDKSIEGVEVVERDSGHAIVYCRGTLFGRWFDGEPFAGIRFIDRFEINGGLITGQWVWNDVALHRPGLPISPDRSPQPARPGTSA